MQKTTPMLRQYLDIKKEYPGTILFFRLGDFYEMFNEDALTGSRELDITLTARHKNTENPVPMCGVPHHAAANYIAKLVRKGYRVAVCEQTEDASGAKKLVKREVVRIVTPGTAIEEQLLESREPVYLGSVFGSGEKFGVAFLELSTGEFLATEFEGADAWTMAVAEIESRGPKEVLYPPSLEGSVRIGFRGYSGGSGSDQTLFSEGARLDSALGILTQAEEETYGYEFSSDLLRTQFGVKELAAFGIESSPLAISAAGACLAYAQRAYQAAVAHVTGVQFYRHQEFMVLDPVSLRNLELISPSRLDISAKRTLLGVIDETVTGMGARLLRSWLLKPLLKISEIEARLAAVEELSETIFRDSLRVLLRDMADVERLVGRLNLGTATPRDLISLRDTLETLPKLRAVLSDSRSLLLQVLHENIHELPEVRELIEQAIEDDPPVNIADGGVIRSGYSEELDELRGLASDAKKTIAGFEKNERDRTGIGSLHIKFNNVFGYFIEVSKSNLAKVPEDYERRQTLANAERFTTPQLKEWESKVLGAEERISELEPRLFREIRSKATGRTRQLQSTARALATLDVLSGLAAVAAYRDYVRPTLRDDDELLIHAGRHPVVEAFSDEQFVPNDLRMNNSTDRLLIITGANMGGKSTVLRQTALIQVLAQIGSFVPASSARLPIVDRIWTRVGASDDLASGRSTFMVEMTETASILRNATPRSLILLDEIGRGTATFDGLAIAWAVAEFLHNSDSHSAKTLFATHYHELTELAENLPGAKNYCVTAAEQDGDIIFLHKLEKGSASKSYGIAVARLAGLPVEVVERAKTVLKKLEQYELAVFADDEIVKAEKGLEAAAARAGGASNAAQFSLFAINNEGAIDELRELDPEDLSDSEIRDLVTRIKKRIV